MTNMLKSDAASEARDEQYAPSTALLSPEQFARESGYRMALTIMKGCLRSGLLTRREYGQIEQSLAQNFSPIWGHLTDVLSELSR